MPNNCPIHKLNTLLTSPEFSRQNSEKIARVCHDAARLVYERLKQTGKKELKSKEVSSALLLAETLHSGAYRFVAEGSLSQLFGGGCDEKIALDYFQSSVMGTVKDKHGRNVLIDEDGMRSLYKDPQSGRHEAKPENYEEVRGKRLPWIRHTLQNSGAIYVVEESLGRSGVRRKFLYTAIVSIRLQHQPEQTSYYVVVVKEAKNDVLKMVTAYSMFERNGFLHAIAMSRPHVQQNKGLGNDPFVTTVASEYCGQLAPSGDSISMQPR